MILALTLKVLSKFLTARKSVQDAQKCACKCAFCAREKSANARACALLVPVRAHISSVCISVHLCVRTSMPVSVRKGVCLHMHLLHALARVAPKAHLPVRGLNRVCQVLPLHEIHKIWACVEQKQRRARLCHNGSFVRAKATQLMLHHKNQICHTLS